jgi:tight adherence protein B
MENVVKNLAVNIDSNIYADSGFVDYDTYIMSKKEKIFYFLIAAIALFALGFVFYHNSIVSLVICPLALLYPKIRTKEIIEKRKTMLNLQFKDMLYTLSSSIASGKPMESAFRDIYKDLSLIYPSEDTYIIKELQFIIKRLAINEPVEEILEDFANRSHLEDIQSFVNVLKTCNRKGGNLVEIIRNTSNVINDKIEIKNEIATLLAQKKFEQKVLSIMPIALIVVLSVTQADYIAPVFNTVLGRVIMTIAIVMIAAGYLISKKIMDIKM